MNVDGLHNIAKKIRKIYHSVRNVNEVPQELRNQDFNVESVNGLLLFNNILPEEIVAHILSFVNWKDLSNCRLVCLSWKSLIDSFVGFEKLRRDHKATLKISFDRPIPITKLNTENVPFYLCFAIAQEVFSANHLKNPFGEAGGHTCRRTHPSDYWGVFYRSHRPPLFKNCSDDCPKFKHWIVTASGGDGWIVEDAPMGSQPLPQELGSTSCFVTSYYQCQKRQCITLKECGLNNKIMDGIQPHIEVSEWYAKRFDCGVIYVLKVSLLNSDKEVIDYVAKEVEDRHGDDEWHQVTHTFQNYGPGIRYVEFEHEGRDTQFWAGHYGSKMAGASVTAKLPVSLLENSSDEASEEAIE